MGCPVLFIPLAGTQGLIYKLRAAAPLNPIDMVEKSPSTGATGRIDGFVNGRREAGEGWVSGGGAPQGWQNTAAD